MSASLNELEVIAVRLAAEHKDQVDLSGQLILSHVIRVAASMRDQKARIVALLHDLVEDTPVTLEDLTLEDLTAHGFPSDIVDAVATLTKQPDEEYFDYITRVARNMTALAVKVADLNDNLLPQRLETLSPLVRLEKETRYRKAWYILVRGAALNNWNYREWFW